MNALAQLMASIKLDFAIKRPHLAMEKKKWGRRKRNYPKTIK
jgi:hypothetical protein